MLNSIENHWSYIAKIFVVFQISGTLLDEIQVRSIVDEIKQVITASSSRKRERAERTKAEDFDAEENELIKEENEQEEEVFDQVRFVAFYPLTIVNILTIHKISCFLPNSLFLTLGGWNLGNFDQNIQSLFLALLWWAVNVSHTYVGKFCHFIGSLSVLILICFVPLILILVENWSV